MESGLHFVGEVLFRRNFPTTLMYLIFFPHPDRLVCDHAQNDGLVRRFFYSVERQKEPPCQEPWSVSKWSHTDLLRLREGRVGAQLWTAYAECRSQHKGTTTSEFIFVCKNIGVMLYYPSAFSLNKNYVHNLSMICSLSVKKVLIRNGLTRRIQIRNCHEGSSILM